MIYLLIIPLFFISSCFSYAQQANDQEHSLAKVSFMQLLPSTQDGLQCAQITVGSCPTPKPPFVGVKMDYWEPALYMETVHAPGDYVIREAGTIVGPVAKSAARTELRIITQNRELEPTAVSTRQSLGGSNLQFNEVHLYDFPFKYISDMVCPSTFGNGFFLRYLSELDSIRWRQALGNPGNVTYGPLGTWGNLYPRIGFMVHPSPLVASAASCMKAVDVMGEGFNFGHNFAIDKVQMVYPYKSSCINIGENLRSRESIDSKDKRYVWLYWVHRSCCRTVSG